MQLTMNAELQIGPKAPFGKASSATIRKRVATFLELEKTAKVAAAATATKTSRAAYTRKRPKAPIRAGRSGRGKMASSVLWTAVQDGVALDVPTLNRNAKHWVIQEVGTNKSATLRVADANRTGVVFKTISIRRQKGRRISSALVWAQAGGTPTPPGMARNQQLFLRKKLRGGGAPLALEPMTIRKEIVGQHFIQKGAKEGFREYQTEVLAAARKTFAWKARL